MFLPDFDVSCDLLLNRRTVTWNLFVLYYKKKQTTTQKAFLIQNLSTWLESRPFPTAPTLTNTKKAVRRNQLSIQMKQSHWWPCVAKEFWLVQENHTTAKLDSRVPSHQRKQNWIAKSTNLEENVGKIETGFVGSAALWAEKLGRCLEYCRSRKSTLGKSAVAVNTGSHSILV